MLRPMDHCVQQATTKKVNGCISIPAFYFTLIVSSLWTTVEGMRALHGFKRPFDVEATSEHPLLISGKMSGYGRFHANDSLIGRFVPCTNDERICFSYNLLFDPKMGRCQPFGGGYAIGCDLMPNRTEYIRGSGHIVGVCREYQDPCTGYRMAYDGRCYWKRIVRDTICGCLTKPTPHFLGGMECRCSPSSPITVEQPSKFGLCAIPDLRFPINRSFFFNLRPSVSNASKSGLSPPPVHSKFRPECLPQQKECFYRGMVWVNETQDCFLLLHQGPCPYKYVVVMSRDLWVRGSAICRHISGGCGPDQKRMAYDGQCHDDHEIALVAPGRPELDIFGEYVIVNYTETRSYTPKVFNDACVIFSGRSFYKSPPPLVHYPKPPCGANKGLCSFGEVIAEKPTPYFNDTVETDYDTNNLYINLPKA